MLSSVLRTRTLDTYSRPLSRSRTREIALMTSHLSGNTNFVRRMSCATRWTANNCSNWWLVLVFHIMLPVVVGVPAALLIPNCEQTAGLNEDGSVRRGDDDDDYTFEHIELDEEDADDGDVI